MDRSKTHHGPVCLDPNRQRCSQCSGRRGSVHMGTQVTSARACPARRACQQQHKCGSVHRMRQRRMQPQLAGTVRMLCIRQRPYTLGLDKLCSQAHAHRHPGYLPRSHHNIGDAMAWYNMSHRTRTFSQEYKTRACHVLRKPMRPPTRCMMLWRSNKIRQNIGQLTMCPYTQSATQSDGFLHSWRTNTTACKWSLAQKQM